MGNSVLFGLVQNKENLIQDEIKFLLNRNGGRVVLYGAGFCGHETLSLFKKHGIAVDFICDDGRIGEYIDGLLITDIRDIKPSKDLIIYVTSGFNRIMESNLKKLGLDLYYRKIDFGRYEENKESYNYLKSHQEEVECAYKLLRDDKSKSLYRNLIQYRISREMYLLDGVQESTPQYYPEEINLRLYTGSVKHSFLDCGAYDGDSIRGFLEYVGGNYERIIAVEASKKNYDSLIENTNTIDNIRCVNIGISDEHKKIRFSISDAKNSFASDEGDDIIEVDSIDNIVGNEKVTFIKMDIEGAEYDALIGAKETIRRDKPVMAISVYHLVDDLWRLQLLIEDIMPRTYDYYLRHYSPTVIETILYAVPKEMEESDGESI